MHERRMGLLVLAPVCFALVIAVAFWYAGYRGIPLEVAQAAIPAYLVEFLLYTLSGIGFVRLRLAALPCWVIALLLTALAPLSWLLLSRATHSANLSHLPVLIGLAALASFWYVVLPRHIAVDLGYLILMAAPVLLGVFEQLYPDPAPRLPGQILGVVMWYRTGLVSVLAIRQLEGFGFGFMPLRREWAIGLRNFLLFLPLAALLAFATGFVQLRVIALDGRTLLIAGLTFFGVLWVLAVAEEFFFRGLLQQQLSVLFRNQTAGLLTASMIFGAAHLPNWRLALLAAVAGIFYGLGYQEA
ncbi:MAG: CPBP family intramembrane metalloprotease, partial [Bryobacteraceae bacterium]|nr:CPBP family intramembrane metalloprotease [Bryobacteraceae bacterium]